MQRLTLLPPMLMRRLFVRNSSHSHAVATHEPHSYTPKEHVMQTPNAPIVHEGWATGVCLMFFNNRTIGHLGITNSWSKQMGLLRCHTNLFVHRILATVLCRTIYTQEKQWWLYCKIKGCKIKEVNWPLDQRQISCKDDDIRKRNMFSFIRRNDSRVYLIDTHTLCVCAWVTIIFVCV